MGGFNPALSPVESLPQPSAQPIPFQPPPREVGADMPGNQRGWAGPAGQAAGIAADVLHGWMAGKFLSEQKKQRDAVTQVGNAKAALDMSVKTAQNIVASVGTADPNAANLTADQKNSLARAQAAVNGAYSAWHQQVGQYVAPPPAQGFGAKVKKAIMPQGPAMISAAALQALQPKAAGGQFDPWSLVVPPSQMQQAAATGAQAGATAAQAGARQAGSQADITASMAALDKKKDELRAQHSQLITANQQAVQSGDQTAIAKTRQDLEASVANGKTYGVDLAIPAYGATGVQQQQISVAGQELANKQQQLQAQQSAFTKMQSGVLPSQLTPAEQVAWTGKLWDPAQEEIWKGFQQQVKSPGNPDGKYNNLQEAAQDYMIQQRRAMLYSRYAPVGIQIQQDTQDRLQTELQDPKAVAQYQKQYPNLAGAIHQIKPGEMPPSSLVSAEAETRLRSTPEERAQAQAAAQEGNLRKSLGETGIARLQSEIAGDAAAQNPEWQRFLTNRTAGGGMYQVPVTAAAVKGAHWWNSDAAARAEFGKFQNAIIDTARQKGMTPAEIEQAFPGVQQVGPPPGTQLGPPPTGGATAAPGFAPPPVAPAAGQPQGAVRRYKVIGPDGNFYYRPWTPEQAARAQRALPPGASIAPQ